jgi:hypothetical protein
VLQIRGDGNLLDCFVGELFRQDASQLLTIFFVRKFTRASRVITPHDHQAVRLGLSKAFHGKRQTIVQAGTEILRKKT